MDKSPDAFRTISEVAEDLDVPQHVLRFWETRFAQIRPLKRGGGRRYYRPDDVDLLKGIRHFLYGEGYTIRGVQRILKADGIRFVQAVGRGERSSDSVSDPEAETGHAPDGDALSLTADQAGGTGPEDRGAGLSGTDVERLRAALSELRECDRVLSALKAPPGVD